MEFKFSDYLMPRKVLEVRRLMQEAPFWSSGTLDAWLRERRLDLARLATTSVPYYRDSFARAGISVSRLGDDEAWHSVPTISKETVVEHVDAMVAQASSSGGVWARTSGSSGMPMRIMHDTNVRAAAVALFWRAWTTGGYWQVGQRQAVMKGAAHEGVVRHNWKLRALLVASAKVSSATVREIRDSIGAFRPKFMRGYPSSMALFCRLLREQDLKLHVPMVISGSETLHDYQRSEIESVLGARVINHWTHWERAGSILECEQGRLHAQQDFGLHEILDANGMPVPPGVEGEITVTGFHNRAMPLIRYRTGDLAMWSTGSCSCGRSFPVVERIFGRETDLLYRKDGLVVPGSGVTSLIKSWEGIRFAQLIQREVGSLEVRIVRGPTYRTETEGRIRQDLARLSDGQLDIAFQYCELDGLERSPVGKLRQCFNRIPQERRPGRTHGLPGSD